MVTPIQYYETHGLTNVTRKRCISKRNQVFCITAQSGDGSLHTLIQKRVSDSAFERDFLEYLYQADVRVPRVLAADKNTLLLEYIEGADLCTWLEQSESQGADFGPALDALNLWLADYYCAAAVYPFKKILTRGDVNLRNFIFDGAQMWSVDFEKRTFEGDSQRDSAVIAAFILTYEPMFTPYKKRAARYFLKNQMLKDIAPLMDKEFEDIRRRRGASIAPDSFVL